MKKNKLLPFILALCLTLCLLTPFASADILDYTTKPESTARNVLLLELSSGRELYAVNPDEKAFPASTTKILTVLLAVEAVERGEVSMDDMVTAQKGFMEGITSDASSADIKEGETMSFRDLLYCAMLPSANEACNIIAMHLDGTTEKFVERMNARAAELGCTGSHFTCTNGMPDEEHYTTARDLSLIAIEALKHEDFRTICGTASYQVAATNMSKARELHNSNALINQDAKFGSGYYYEDAYGIKTGRTEAAGLCIVAAAHRGDLDLLCVVLGAEEDIKEGRYESFGDCVKLFDWGFGNFSYRCLLEKNAETGSMPVVMGDGRDSVTLAAVSDVTAFAPMGLSPEHMELRIELQTDSLTAPVKADTVVGKVSVYDDKGTLYGETELKTAEDINLDVFQYLKEYVKNFFIENWIVMVLVTAGIIILVFIIILLRSRARKIKKTPKKKKAKLII
ncbi:MAG: D-alanyl-D-alanine carboxypeptidase, partial [Oscillospiraceae bacterium]|nr:D-alanyl-D-alanine carboxypeptidase [Oscillospiraceae bacterium]